MTNDEINRYIHEQIMGKCWHEYAGTPDNRLLKNRRYYCANCEQYADEDGYFEENNPAYCSDASPRSLLNEVVDKVADLTEQKYERSGIEKALITIIQDTRPEVNITSPAEQLARACVEAHKAQLTT